VPSKNIAVALLCGTEGPGALDTLRQRTGVEPGGVGELLAKEIADLSAGRDEVTLIAGNGLRACPAFNEGAGAFGTGAFDAVDEVIVAPAGQPCTGTWWELAGGLRAWGASGRRVLLADYEPMLGYLCVAAFDVEAARPNGGRLLCRTTRKTTS
jgi:hypothetical protein